ncbi:MAG TPA: diacylglycerol kinase family protein [Patescibacteria group bacterium]|nr:diacylglycerol kinase family protein [Patescibacteria group bacterium]
MKSNSIFDSFGYAIGGIVHSISDNRNMRIHIVVAIFVFLAAILFHLPKDEMIDVMVMMVLVIGAEMINTSIEEMTDLITTEHRKEARIAKDVAAGTVLVISSGAAIIGIYIFLPYIIKLLN